MVDLKKTLPGTLLGALAYGAGMVLGSALTVWLTSLVTLASIADASQMVRILVGVLLHDDGTVRTDFEQFVVQ